MGESGRSVRVQSFPVMMKTIACVGCGGEVAVPETLIGRRGECPLCGARFAVPGEGGEPDASASASATLSLFGRRWPFALPRFEWPFGGPRARRCVVCQRNQFGAPGPCKFCGGETVGLDVAGVAEGLDGALLEADRDFRRQTRLLNIAASTIWGVAAALVFLLLLETLRQRFWLLNGIFFAIFAAPVVVAAAWLHAKAIALVASRFAEKHSGRPEVIDPASARAREVGRIREQIVEPFLDRHGIGEDTPARAPEAERDLLRQLLAREGFPMAPDRCLAFLTACAFRRAFEGFRERIAGKDGPIAAFAEIAPEEGDDRGHLPFLQQVLAEAGRNAEEAHVAAVLHDVRRERKLKSFAADLRQRKPAPNAVASGGSTPADGRLTIEQVDRMNAYNFDLLAGMIYQAQGYFVRETPKAGAQGADVLLERAGERTVVQTKLDPNSVGNAAVQEAMAAKVYYHCHHAIILSNHHFTPSAVELALRGGVTLVDRAGLMAMLDAFNHRPKDHARLAVLLQPTPVPFGPRPPGATPS